MSGKAFSLITVWRTLFGLLLLSAVVLLFALKGDLNIDTDLAELSPQNQHSAGTRNAINELSSSIQKRIILLVSGANEDDVLEAHDALYDRLSMIDLVQVQPSTDELAEQLISGLKPYRFSLLSERQGKLLASQSAEEIASNAEQQLYQLSGQARVYSFLDDPLGWHSNTLLELFSAPGSGISESPQGTSQSLGLVIKDGALNMTTQAQLNQQLLSVTQDIEQTFSVSIDRSGIFFFAAHAAKTSKRDISLISTGSSIGVVLLLLFAFRSVRALVLPFISVALGVGFAFAVTHTLYGNVHILTIVFGASLIGIVIDYSLHFFYHRVYHGMADNTALHRALFLSLMTSLIGYAALSFSSLAALQKVAVFSCCGLCMAWLSVVCLGDFSINQSKTLSPNASIFGRLVAFISKVLALLPRQAWSMISVLLIMTAGLIIFFSQPFDDDPRVFFKAPASLIDSERRVAEVANDYEPGRYIIVSGQTAEQVYQRHAELFELIDNTPELSQDNFTSLLNWIPDTTIQDRNHQLQKKLYGPDGAATILMQRIADKSDISALTEQYLDAKQRYLTPDGVKEILGSAVPPFWVEDDQSIVNFVLIRKGMSVDKVEELTRTIPGVEYVNTLSRTRTALAEQRASASKLLLLAYCLIALLIFARYRKLSALWLVAVPIFSSAMLFILGSLFGFYLNLFHVMALFLVLGFGMDYTIFAHEMRAQGSVTLQAILLSALTSLLSFGLLALSSIPVVASFGFTLLVGNLFNLLGAFVYSQATQNTQAATV